MPTSYVTDESMSYNILKSDNISENASSLPPETVTKIVTSTRGARISAWEKSEKGEESKDSERANGLRLKVDKVIDVEVNCTSLDEFQGPKSGESEGNVRHFEAEEGYESREIKDVEMKRGCDLVVGKNGSSDGLHDASLRKSSGAKSSESEGDEGNVESKIEFDAHELDCKITGKESDIWIEKQGSNAEENEILDGRKFGEESGSVETNERNLEGMKEDEMREMGCKITEDVETEGGYTMGVKENGSKEEEQKVLDRKKSKRLMGRLNLSFEEWLQLPANNPNVKQEKVDEMEVECAAELKGNEQSDIVIERKGAMEDKAIVKVEPNPGVVAVGSRNLTFHEWLQLPENNPNIKQETVDEMEVNSVVKVKEEPDMSIERKGAMEHNAIVIKKDEERVCVQPISVVRPVSHVHERIQMFDNCKPSYVKKGKIEENALSTVLIENGDFPEELDWLLVGRSVITGLSTTKRRKVENNEIVHFSFPDYATRSKCSSNRAANAAFSIVRFSTKRNGEIGRLTTEWSNCLVPLVNSGKVKVLGRCIAAPLNLHTFQEMMLYASFYIHHSVFTEGGSSSWKLEPTQIDSTTYPLLRLFELLKIKPFQKAEFTPEELDSRKRSLNLGGVEDEFAGALPMVKRRKSCQQYLEQNKDEQAINETSLNKVVGAADVYDLKEMDPPGALMCDLRPYQKQALYCMSESEKGVDVEEAKKMLHPCWAAYRICDKRAPAIYLNNFTGEATTRFPAATQIARGGILADAMGLGKTVMTIALILARRGRGSPDDQEFVSEGVAESQCSTQTKRGSGRKASRKVKGGTLIICPMALLSQWKDELETHSMSNSISIFVHYGGSRSDDAKVIAEPDVVLTTYGVLTAAYKNDGENSIFHQVDWYRVVLDEAHTIKSSKTQGAQAAYTLSSYCRWCLTGTPLQNSLEDLYSLLCFLHVEPWCNWAWWHKLIQRPYENGDKRGLKLIKAILRPLMLRRTKETTDKEGRPILVLPPTDIQIIECEQSEDEHDFYDALFRRSKVQFDQFVAQGKVLHNYANILELLLRLRQCCNHPFLVMSRGDTQEYADLNKLARKFLENSPENASHKVPTRAYIEEVVEGLKKGENAECPICLESADDPVLTPCAHRMCRECLLSSWRSPSMGFCPICRQLLKKNELITCPSENRFRIDVDKNWKESSKVTKLLDCLECIHKSGFGEKSIVFSQWTSFLDLLEIPLKRRKIGYLRFDGKLQQKQREKVLKEFNETKEKKVLLMSLRAGGVGLNLTTASNVFLMDPWWNPAVEEQAIMRIHRIGQKRTVRVRRFIVKDTVEERMQQVQARKQNMIEGALTDEDVRSARIEELKMLFR